MSDDIVYQAKKYLLNDPVIRIKHQIEDRLQKDMIKSCTGVTRIVERILIRSLENREIADYKIFAEINKIIVFVIETNYTETEVMRISIKE